MTAFIHGMCTFFISNMIVGGFEYHPFKFFACAIAIGIMSAIGNPFKPTEKDRT